MIPEKHQSEIDTIATVTITVTTFKDQSKEITVASSGLSQIDIVGLGAFMQRKALDNLQKAEKPIQ